MKNFNTIVHAYSFMTDTPQGKTDYSELCERMALAGIACFESHGGNSHYRPELDGMTVDLEVVHVFNNQWNTAPVGENKNGLRVFDWAQDYVPNRNKNLKRGHWLEMSDAMRAVRIDTHECGYCGTQCAAESATSFCPSCIGSEYLSVKDLSLTRMQSVANKARRSPLNEVESIERLALYKAIQIHGNTERDRARIAKKRIDIAATRNRTIANANTEHDGHAWLLDHGITTSAIYYTHTCRFEFGWSRPVESLLMADLVAALEEFPFPFDIKEA